MKLKSTGLKWMKFLHLVSTGIWFGGAVCVGGLAVLCFLSENPEALLTTAPVITYLYSNIIFFAAIFTLIQGIIYGFFTNWGFFKHRWLLLKWILVILLFPCTAMGITQTFAAIGYAGQELFEQGFAAVGKALIFIACQIILMLVIILLSVFKPGSKKTASE